MSQKKQSISQCIEENLTRYFHDLGSETPCGVYDMMLEQMEIPLLRFMMQHCHGNQTRVAHILGLNRTTLRKKLIQYNMIDSLN